MWIIEHFALIGHEIVSLTQQELGLIQLKSYQLKI